MDIPDITQTWYTYTNHTDIHIGAQIWVHEHTSYIHTDMHGFQGMDMFT